VAFYHHSIIIICRGKGKSVMVSAVLYAGETITSEYNGITHGLYHEKRCHP